MQLLDAIRHPLQFLSAAWASPWQDDDALTQATLAHLEGASDYDKPITRATAMSIGALAKVRHLLVGTVSRFPLVAWKGDDPKGVQPSVVTQPEAGRPRLITLVWVFDMLLWYGRAWFVVTERELGGRLPTRVEFIPEWRARVEGGQLVEANGKPVAPGDVIRVDGFHEGLLNFARPRIQEALDADMAAANAALNPVPSVELHQTSGQPMTDAQIDALTARWTKARRKRGGGVAYTNQAIETKIHGQPAEQLLIDGRNMAALNLVRAAGFPAWSADIAVPGSSITYSNLPSRLRELVDLHLAAYMACFEARWSMDDVTAHGTTVRFDTYGFTRADFKESMEGLQIAREVLGYSTDEARTLYETGTIVKGTATA